MKKSFLLALCCVLVSIFVLNSCKNDEDDPAPVIASVDPNHGPVGTSITISGSNFTDDATVTFNGVPATVVSATVTQLVVTVPQGATTGTLRVTSHNKMTDGPTFTVEFAPTVTLINPSSGKVGDQVIISGSNFSTTVTQNIVKFNGTVAQVSTATATQLTVTVPAGVTNGAVTVEVNSLIGSGPAFTVIPPPAVSNISPTSGLPGSNVIITGTNFSATASANTVKFNGVSATVSNATTTELTVVVPASATSGAITVEVNAMTATGGAFTVIPPVTVTNVAPQVGPPCTSVTITGSNFSTTMTDNVVKINGTNATVTSATANQLVVSVPSAATTGVITVTTNNQTVTGPSFTVKVNEAALTMDAIEYTYGNFCTSIVSNRFWISASGGFTSPRPSWAIHFTGLRPSTAGAYPADITAERPGETWNFTPTTVNVSFDAENRMVVTFNLTLTGRGGTANKAFSGTVKVY